MLHGTVPSLYKGNPNFWKDKLNVDKEFHKREGFETSKDAEDFLDKIMAKNINDAITSNEIKSHPWFKGVNWEKY